MSASRSEPLRGDAAFRASIAAIAKRNQVAQAEAARRREQKDVASVREASRRERLEARDLPRQPGR
jgi:hypothetical protein